MPTVYTTSIHSRLSETSSRATDMMTAMLSNIDQCTGGHAMIAPVSACSALSYGNARSISFTNVSLALMNLALHQDMNLVQALHDLVFAIIYDCFYDVYWHADKVADFSIRLAFFNESLDVLSIAMPQSIELLRMVLVGTVSDD